MAGTNAGTGQPISFACAKWRRERDYRNSCSPIADGHAVTLTGRTKPRRFRAKGARMSTKLREYRCACGHVGWSAHNDLERVAARG